MGYKVSARLVQENAELVKKLEGVDYFRRNLDEYNAICKVLQAHCIMGWRGKPRAQELDEALSRSCPEDVSAIRKTLEGVVERLKRIEESKSEDQQETEASNPEDPQA